MATDTDVGARSQPRRPAGRKHIFMWGFAGIALCAAVVLAIAAGRIEIALAAVLGVAVAAFALVITRRQRRAEPPFAEPPPMSRAPRRRAGWLWMLALAAAAVTIGLVSVVFVKTNDHNPSPGLPNAVAVQTVSYHAEGHLGANGLVLLETIELNDRAISGATPASEVPAGTDSQLTVAVDGWREAGRVDGFPSFQRTRELAWSQTSRLSRTATVALTIGDLTVTVANRSSGVMLVPDADSRVELTLPRNALGAAVPVATSRTVLPARDPSEIIVFAVDRYVHEISFDVLASAVRAQPGKVLYDASRTGFWSWAAGAATTVVGGFLVDKLAGLLWRLVAGRTRSWLRRLRGKPTPA